jgi:hypothetical protein
MAAVTRHLVLPAALLAFVAATAQAQSVCSSDGQPAPRALLERFINADCAGCWTDLQAAEPARGEAVLDWIVPGSRGEDAPLSAAARPEALERLAALARAMPRNDDSRRAQRRGRPVSVRVARGLPFNDYIGASIELRDPGPGAWRAWLVLVEVLPAGTERTPVARNLVRNVLELSWDARSARGRRRVESRPMNIPAGADPERLQVLGLVEDARGQLRGIAQSRCGRR